MHFTPAETEKLLLSVAAMVARDRLERGVLLNHPETVALLSSWVIERAREGARRRRADAGGPHRPHARSGHAGRSRDARRRAGRGDLPRRPQARHRPPPDRLRSPVASASSRAPARTGSSPGPHRAQRRPHGRRAHPARVRQHRRPPDPDRLAHPPARCRTPHWNSTARSRTASASTSRREPRSDSSPAHRASSMPWRSAGAPGARHPDQDRRTGAARWSGLTDRGTPPSTAPPSGDEVRLGDTDLWIQIERDLTVGGEEAVFGGGKSIRESMAQSTATRADGALDTVITNAIILDWWGIIRADIGIRDGRIVGIGHAGQPRHQRRHRHDHRSLHRCHLGRGAHRHGRRDRLARAPALALADPRGARHRDHHDRGRRHGAVGGIEGDHRHPRGVAPVGHAPRARSAARERPAARQGQHRVDAAR